MPVIITRRRFASLLAGSAVSLACGLTPRPAQVPGRAPSPTPVPSIEPATGDASVGSGFDVELHQREAAYAQLAISSAASSELGPITARLANWPMNGGRISSPFGPRWGGFHNGVDVAAPLYTPILAAARGQVVIAGKPSLAYGDTATIVIIAHGDGFATLYAHLNDERPPIVKTGEMVNAGQVIAYNGSTGWSTGPHVHFTTIVSMRAVDPTAYLPSR
jgi:murein DD-endopeptidase MepM/ murein hydrolase activator NlpD